MPDKRVLLTGASGFVGSHCITALLSLGYEVHALSTRPADRPDAIWHQANLLDPVSTKALVGQIHPTHLLHLAWVVTPGLYWTSPENFDWVKASLTLLEAFAANGGQRAVMVGTCAEYDWQHGRCIEYKTPRLPTTIYGTCKYALAMMLEAFGTQRGISTAWARLFYLYGPREHPTRLIPSVIRALLADDLVQCTHGNQCRDFLYVQDAAEALSALLDSDVDGAVNIASGVPVTLKMILQTIGRHCMREHRIQFGAKAAPLGEPPLIVADVTRLTKEVGWLPKVTLPDGIIRTIGWWEKERLCRNAALSANLHRP